MINKEEIIEFISIKFFKKIQSVESILRNFFTNLDRNTYPKT